MDRPLKEHLAFLEQRVRQLHDEVMQNRLTKAQRNNVEAEIRAAELALNHYRQALEIENTLAR